MKIDKLSTDRRSLPWVALLPLLLVSLLIGHTQALVQPSGAGDGSYWPGQLMLLLWSGPMFVGQFALALLCYRQPCVPGSQPGAPGAQRNKRLLLWLLAAIGLVLYPLLWGLGFAGAIGMSDICVSAIGMSDASLGLPLAAAGWWLTECLRARLNTDEGARTTKLLSLDAMVLLGLGSWALLMAGVFNSLDDPMLNQPFELVLDLGRQLEHLPSLFSYGWQFVLMALLVFSFYWVNRYLLIRQCLHRFGVPTFVMAALLALLLLTPLFASLIIALPVNQLPEGIELVVPGGNRNPFDAHNYRFMFVVWLLSTPIILAFERQQQASRFAAIAQQQAQTELQLLQQQVNPHFLFNTLNSLYALTLMKADEAPERLLQLSGLLRYSVYRGQQSEVTLAEEVACLKDYLALQQIRQGSRLELEVQWPDEHCETLLIAPLLYLVLLENAFKHGLEPGEGQGLLRMRFWQQGQSLCFSCENSLPRVAPTKQVGGMGLDNLARRLELLYPARHRLVSEQRGQHWFAQLEVTLAS